jgi:hypothetical protein
MMMAKTTAEFDTAYKAFINEMKVRGHDAETLAEFNKQYKAYVKTPAGKITVKVTRYIPRNVYATEPVIVGR